MHKYDYFFKKDSRPNQSDYNGFKLLVVFKTVTARSEHKYQLNRKNLLQRTACLKHKERNGS